MSEVSSAVTSASTALTELLEAQLDALRGAGKYKHEVVISSPQQAHIDTEGGNLLNLCANNYLGLAFHPAVMAAARKALDERGAGMASVRFICGTLDEHRLLEQEIAAFLGYEDAILYNSCFDANVGLFEAFTTRDDVIVSDQLNHASIIDGVRLSKAQRLVYSHGDMADLRAKLEQTSDARLRVIATDGVFSMEGDLAELGEIVSLAEEFGALVMVDDSHGVGVVGKTGRGTVEHFGMTSRVHMQTGTFGKALGGAAGGYVVGPQALIDIQRQQSRPYLFSNALPPAAVGTARAALRILQEEPGLVTKLHDNVAWFREAVGATGYDALPGDHAIVALLIGDEQRALDLAQEIRAQGVMVVAFTYPVVPQGAARIRVQISAAHSREDLETAVGVLSSAGRALGIIR
jgi:glycine C-acetyltransferase